MKIIHCADLHIDSKMQTNLSADKARERRKELLLTFERMVDYAKMNDVDAIIIAGDMFDTARVTNKSRDAIFNIISSNKNIDFFYLPGNHDEENIISQLDQDHPNLHVFGENWTTFDYGDIDITGIKLNSKMKSTYDMLNLSKDKFNIVVLHGQISKHNSQKDAVVVNLPKLKNKHVDYLALGHIHSFEIDTLDDRGKWAYSGCMEGRGFDECGDKGFVLIKVEDKRGEYEFIPFAKRTLHEIQFDITGINDWFDIERGIDQCAQGINSKDLVKVVLIGKFNLGLNKQIEHLEAKLNDIYYFAKVKDLSSLQLNAKDFENDMSLRGEFIREVLNSSLSEEEKEQVVIVGMRALSGEELK